MKNLLTLTLLLLGLCLPNSLLLAQYVIAPPPDNAKTGTITNDDVNCPATANAGADQTNVCEIAMLTANTPSNGTGTWTASPAGGSFGNVNTPSTTFMGNIGITYTLTWTITTTGCPTTSDQVLISFSGDTDGDTVPNCKDCCPGGDDRINTDGQGMPDACDCNPTDNSDEVVAVPGLDFIDSVATPGTYQSAFTLSSFSKINGGSTVIFKAGKSITLTEGFYARSGSIFSAIVELCKTPAGILEIAELEAKARTNQIEKATKAQNTEIKWEVSPNPFQEVLKIKATFPEFMERVSVLIYDNTGRLSRTVLWEAPVEAGKQEWQVAARALPLGMAYIILQTSAARQVRKVVRLE